MHIEKRKKIQFFVQLFFETGIPSTICSKKKLSFRFFIQLLNSEENNSIPLLIFDYYFSEKILYSNCWSIPWIENWEENETSMSWILIFQFPFLWRFWKFFPKLKNVVLVDYFFFRWFRKIFLQIPLIEYIVMMIIHLFVYIFGPSLL